MTRKQVATPARKKILNFTGLTCRVTHAFVQAVQNSVAQFFPYDFDPRTFGMQVGDAELEAVT